MLAAVRQHRARQHYSSPPDRDVDDAVKAGVPWVLGSKGKMMKKTDHTFLIAALLSIFGLAHANDPCNCQGYAGIGGPCYAGVGGPAYAGVGGPAYAGVGGACYAGIGGPAYSGISGPKYDGIGGPSYKGIGGPAYNGIGGPAYNGIGGPCYAGIGGPCYAGIGGGNSCPSVCGR